MTSKEALYYLIDLATEQCKHSEPPGVDLLEALLRRDWAVRVLDAHTAHEGRLVTVHPSRDRIGGPWLFFGVDGISEPTPEAARLAAAEAVWPELPESIRAELGERP